MSPPHAERLTPAGARVLNAASELFYREGLRGVGVDGIARAAGVTKKTLYDCFGSKDRLIAAYLRRRDELWRAWLLDRSERRGDSSREALLGTFDALAEWQRERNPRGCAFRNALAELPDTAHPGRTVISEHKSWMLDHLTGLAASAEVPTPEAVAKALFLLQEGALAAHEIEALGDPWETARSTAESLLD